MFGLFEDFMDAGEHINKARRPKELLENKEFWDEEKANTAEAKLCLGKLKNLGMYDLHEMRPQAYRGGQEGKKEEDVADRDAPQVNGDMTENQAAGKGAVKEDVERFRELYFMDGEQKDTVETMNQGPDRTIRDGIREFMEQYPGYFPDLTRGKEQELDTIRDMEALRANMINQKIHLDGNQIRNAFLFKADLIGNHEGFP